MNSINVDINDLYLDPNNFRLQNNLNYEKVIETNIKSTAIQKRTFEAITGGKQKKHTNIKDLISSIKSNGYIKVDNILVRNLPDGGYLIIEGNRRLAALKVLKEEYDLEFDIGNLNPNIFLKPESPNDKEKGIEVVLIKDEQSNDHYNILMGLKHVSGNKKWHRFNQAKLLYDLYTTYSYSFGEIAQKIGLNSASQVKNEIFGYSAMLDYIEYIKKNEVSYDDFDPYDKFMIFLTLLSKPKLREWLEWSDDTLCFQNLNNKQRFYSWISPSEMLDEENSEEISYITKPPKIDNHKDIRTLSDFIDDDEFIDTMEETGSFTETLNSNIKYTQRTFSSKLQSIYNAIKSINIDNINNMTEDDLSVFNRITQTLERLKHFRGE